MENHRRFAGEGLAFAVALLLLSALATGGRAQDKPSIEIVPNIGHSDWVHSVAFSADGARALSGSTDNTLKLWDAASGRPTRSFEGHSSWVRPVAFLADGARVLSGS